MHTIPTRVFNAHDLLCLSSIPKALNHSLQLSISRLSITRFTTRPITRALILVLALFTPALSSAVVLFADDFSQDNSNTTSGHWHVSERDESDIAVYRERLRLRDFQTNAKTYAQSFVDTTGYINMHLNFDWQVLSSTEASDFLHVGFGNKGLTQFDEIISISLGETGTFTTGLNLQPTRHNYLTFWLDVNSQSESVYIDNIRLDGDVDSASSTKKIPEPNSLYLLGLGLFGIAQLRKKKVLPKTIVTKQAIA